MKLWHEHEKPVENSFVLVKIDGKMIWSVYEYVKGYFWSQNHWDNNYRILKIVDSWCYVKDVENAEQVQTDRHGLV